MTKKTISEARDDIAAIRHEFARSRERIAELSEALKTAEGLIAARDKRIAELEGQINSIEEYGTEEINGAVDLRRDLVKAKGRIAELEQRLEMDREFQFDPEKRELVPVDIPPEKRSFDHDGISCRDETIKLLEERIAKMRLQEQEMSNVVELGTATRLDIPAEKVLKSALDRDLKSIVIVGIDKDGNEYFASTMADGGDCIYWLQRGIWRLNKIADKIEEEG